VRLTGNERAWMVYKMIHTTSNLLPTLFIQNLSLRGESVNLCMFYASLTISCAWLDMAEFEETFVQRLAVNQAREFLRVGRTNILAYYAPSGNEARMLDFRRYE
jgi:hypothetical protein